MLTLPQLDQVYRITSSILALRSFGWVASLVLTSRWHNEPAVPWNLPRSCSCLAAETTSEIDRVLIGCVLDINRCLLHRTGGIGNTKTFKFKSTQRDWSVVLLSVSGNPRLILIMPDTSPRGEGVPDEDPKAQRWDLVVLWCPVDIL